MRTATPRTSRPTSLPRIPMPNLGALRRIHFGRPGMRSAFALTGIATVLAIVVGLVALLPSVPAAPVATGSIYQVTWSSASNPPTRFDFGPYFTTFGSDLMMLGTTGTTTTVWSSSDGTSWQQVSAAGAFTIPGRRFVAQGFSADGSGGLVTIGNSVGAGTNDVAATAWHSRDGRTWTLATVNSGSGQEMIGGSAARPGVVVTAGYGVAWSSTDGINWTAHVLPGALNYLPRAVASWDGGFVIIGLWTAGGDTRSAVWYSETGDSWILSTTVLDGFDVRGVASNGGRIVAVGSDTSSSADGLAASWSSTDGNAWLKATARTDQADTAMDGVAFVDGGFVAVGAADKSLAGTSSVAPTTLAMWISEDGTWWLPLTGTAQPVTRGHMAAIDNHVILVGGAESGQKALIGSLTLGPVRAPTASPSAPSQYTLALKAGETPMIVDITANDALGPVAAASDRFLTFVTRPAGTTVWASPNGSLWAQEVTPAGLVTTANNGRPVILQAISDGKGGVIAIGRVTSSTGDSGTIWRLPKGGDWHQATLNDDAPPEFSSVAVGSNGYVAASDQAGGSTIMYSTDGETWNAGAIAVTGATALTVAAYQYGYVAVASDPAHNGATTAWTSPDGRTWTMRSDWRLPINVTGVFGIGTGLVAVTNGTGVAPSPSASPTPKASPTAAGTGTASRSTWWWSSTGLAWKQSGLVMSGSNYAVVNGRILAFDVPTKAGSGWVEWSTSDGKSWQNLGPSTVSFAYSPTCRIASIGSRIAIVGWDAKAQLKDFFGSFSGS